MISLWPEPINVDEAMADIREDGFISVAFIVCGIEANWRAALAQTCALIRMVEADERLDQMPPYRLVSMLIARAETFDNTGAFLDEIVDSLGMLPGTDFMEEIRMAHIHKIDPQAWQREKNRKWIEWFRARAGQADEITKSMLGGN